MCLLFTAAIEMKAAKEAQITAEAKIKSLEAEAEKAKEELKNANAKEGGKEPKVTEEKGT
jgi:hypothetical protein